MDACLFCRAGSHEQCDSVFDASLADDAECCCSGQFSLHEFYMQETRRELEGAPAPARGKAAPVGEPPAQQPKGDSGYIHPDAWLGMKNLGELTDPLSTGRKRVVRMYPISAGQVCDWAGKKNCGGGPKPVVGCINNPATDQHHGPDKNTLNNAKSSRGVGTTENVHIICSECHNAWHAANDPHYPPYDRLLEQAKPWLPIFPDGPWGGHEPQLAEYDELASEDRRRHEQARARGRENRGRNGQAREEGDFSVDED